MREAILFLLYSVPVALLLFVLIRKTYRKYYIPCKMICSAAYLALGFYCAYQGSHVRFFYCMLPGYILCFCGDAFLGIYNRSSNKKFLMTGLFSFLFGHVVFVTSFWVLQELSLFDFAFPVVFVLITVWITNQKSMFLGKLKPYVYLYSFFVSMMFGKSVLLVLEVISMQRVLLACGATLFLISDYMILFLYFYKHRAWCVHGINVTTYYYGMFLLALSLLY